VGGGLSSTRPLAGVLQCAILTGERNDETAPQAVTRQRYRDGVATIEYQFPTHGKVEPLNASAGVPVCSLTLVRTIAGELRAEQCGQPLTAYFE